MTLTPVPSLRVTHDQLVQDAEPYYWEDDREVDPPLTKQVWHTLHWTGYKVFQGMELAGEVIADFLGLNQSRYQVSVPLAAALRAAVVVTNFPLLCGCPVGARSSRARPRGSRAPC